jgi:hypothetical protein
MCAGCRRADYLLAKAPYRGKGDGNKQARTNSRVVYIQGILGSPEVRRLIQQAREDIRNGRGK